MARSMFHPENNRLNYGELLIPEIGYTLDFAVGLTYSLDLEALLGVPVSLGMLDDIGSSQMDSPFFLLEAIRKSSDRIAIFCNAGSIKLPQEIRPVFALLEQSVFEVKLKKGANFHPKLWIIRYQNSEGNKYIKIIVLSRNLTYDRSFDVAIELSGTIGSIEQETNRPLSDILQFVASYANRQKSKEILNLANEIMKVNSFSLGEQFEKYAFHTFGINNDKTKAESLFSDADDLIVISPFLSDGIIKSISNHAKRKTLITRKNSVNQTIMNCFSEIYITKDVILNDELLEESNDPSKPNRDIHAKIYFKNSHLYNYLYLGSLNASANAFYHNVEFMIELQFKTYQTSYQTMLKDFLPVDNCPFEKLEIVDSGMLPDNEENSSNLSDVVYALKNAEVYSEGNRYNIRVSAKTLKSPAKIAPFYRRHAFVQLDEETIISGLLLQELSEFFIVNRDGEFAVVKIQTKGIPIEERDNAIYKSIINNKKAFLAYITLMLSDNFTEVYLEQSNYMDDYLQGRDNSTTELPSALYERMLKTVVTQPRKINEIENLMNKLDPTIITDDFRELLAAFKIAAKKVKK